MGVGWLKAKLGSKLGELQTCKAARFMVAGSSTTRTLSSAPSHSLALKAFFIYAKGLLVTGALLHLLKEPHECSVVHEQGM
ncbi:hypothetical protein D8674_023451 [Pyrus ussuriensis x Pyrus communis]|uniref:Uncharacterized protein n=1 Tax=Pyrus ussuriensis x Pyrus communis TaxID=2448454 RepID=A0A5N5H069_9ROSA|nr:hypothetical protein D8674_023451 [Pyrus ussuriensis x Pyrus communis]